VAAENAVEAVIAVLDETPRVLRPGSACQVPTCSWRCGVALSLPGARVSTLKHDTRPNLPFMVLEPYGRWPAVDGLPDAGPDLSPPS